MDWRGVAIGLAAGYATAWLVQRLTGRTLVERFLRWRYRRRVERAGPILRNAIDRLEAERERLRGMR